MKLSRIPEHLVEKINKIPSKPGIYKMKDIYGNIMYIGKSKTLKARVKSYFSTQDQSNKIERMLFHIHEIDYIVTDTHLEAQILECALIKNLRPIYNTQFKNHENYRYLKVEDYNNRLKPIKIITEREAVNCFGPYRNKKMLLNLEILFQKLLPIAKHSDTYQFTYKIIPEVTDKDGFQENKQCLIEIFSQQATGVMASIAILNIVLDYIFLFPLDMGIKGAALATGISQSIGASIFLGYFIYKTKKKSSGLSFGTINRSWGVIPSIAMNGSSELFNSIALGLSTFLYNRIILSYAGAMGVAAFSLVQYLLLFGMTIFMGMGNGTQPIISYNHGGGLSHRVSGVLKRLMLVSIITSLVIFILLRWQAEVLISIFIPNHVEALKLTLQVADYLSWSILFMPVGIIGSVYFTAVEEPGKSLVVAISRGLLFTLMGLAVFPQIWGEVGIWITPVFAEVMAAAVAVTLMYKWIKKYEEIIV